MTGRPKTVSTVLAQYGLLFAEKCGVGPQEFHRLTGISELEAKEDGGRICAAKHIAMSNLLEGRLQGERIAQYLDPIEYAEAPLPSPGFLLLFGTIANAPCLNVAFDKYLEYRPLIGDVDTMSFKREEAVYEFAYGLDGAGRSSFSAYGNFMLMARLAKQYDPGSKCIPLIELTGDAFASPKRLGDVEPCRVRFGQSRNRMVLTAPSSDQDYSKHNDSLYASFSRQATSACDRLRRRYSFGHKVETMLVDLLRGQEDEPVTLDLVCERLAISRWGVHRRLQQESSNFQSILTRVRIQEAKRLLMQNGVSLAEISDSLGFSSLSSFSRFFSDQYGISPSRYRAANSPD